MAAYVITPDDLEAFTRCRRQWDLGARARSNLKAREETRDLDVPAALHAALAVYYFPGMWSWERAIVRRLVEQAFLREIAGAAPTERNEARREQGLAVLSRYLDVAPALDEFVPLRVVADFEANVPDADRPGEDLATDTGDAVRYRGRVDLVVMEEDETLWIVQHRFGETLERDPDLLLLDERLLTLCWGWEQCFLADRIEGVLYNDVGLGAHAGSVTRTRVARGPTDLYRCGQRLSVLAREMLAAELVVYPSPSEGHCRPCPFRAPCIAMNEGVDAERLLARDFDVAPDDVVEGRLGGASWSMGRGAAPFKFGRDTRGGRAGDQ